MDKIREFPFFWPSAAGLICIVWILESVMFYAAVFICVILAIALCFGIFFAAMEIKSRNTDIRIRELKAITDCQAMIDESVFKLVPKGHRALMLRGGRESMQAISAPEQGLLPPALMPDDGHQVSAGIDENSGIMQDRLSDFGMSLNIVRKIEAPQLVRYLCQPEGRTDVSAIRKKANDIQMALQSVRPVMISDDRGHIAIDIPKPETDYVRLSGLKPGKPGQIPVGMGVDGNVVNIDFSDPNQAHLLIAGTTGGGKSEFLKTLVSGFDRHPHAETAILDMKILTFGCRPDCVTEAAEGVSMLRYAAETMDTRYKILAGEGFENLTQRHAAGRHDMPWHFAVIDEYAELILAYKGKERDEIETTLCRIAAKGRAAGVHMILATQRPDAKVVNPLIKANLPAKVCLKVTNGINSQVILDQPGGEKLSGNGDALGDFGGGVFRFQSAYDDLKNSKRSDV